MKKYQEFDAILKSAKNILIVSHVNPDGDTLGSMCALHLGILSNYKKKSEMLILSKLPQIYAFLPCIKQAKTLSEFDKSREYDLVIAVDVASLDRLIDAKILFDKAKFSVNIDHHRTNDNYGTISFVEPKASSTGEVLYKIMKKLQWGVNILPSSAKGKQIQGDKYLLDIATCLYTAILTDTGGFRFENTSAQSFKIAAELTEMGVNPKELYKKCYESKTKAMMLFQNYCVSKAVFSKKDKIAYAMIYKKDMEKFGVGDDATDGIVESLRAIVEVEAAFVVKETDSRVCKISMRSKNMDISKVCSRFGGGGHKFAAGCTIKSTCDEAIKKILNEIGKEIE